MTTEELMAIPSVVKFLSEVDRMKNVTAGSTIGTFFSHDGSEYIVEADRRSRTVYFNRVGPERQWV